MQYVTIFTRTFLQIATPALIAAAAADWVNGDRKLNASLLGLGLLVAFVGAVVATGTAYIGSPATSRLQKSTRSAVQAALGLVATLPVNAVTDVVAWPPLLIGGVSLITGAFVATWFSYVAPIPAPTA